MKKLISIILLLNSIITFSQSRYVLKAPITIVTIDTVQTTSQLSLYNASSSINTLVVANLLTGGTFYKTTVGILNNATVFSAYGGGYWTRIYKGAVNIDWFGAVHDGITVDSTAFKNAFSYGFKNIILPKGVYNLSSYIMNIVSDSITLTGEKGTTLLSSGIRFRAATYPSTLACAILIDHAKYFTIKNIEVKSTDTQTATYIGISLQSASDATIDNCVIKGFALMGVRTNGADRLNLINSRITKIGSPGSVLKDSVALTYAAPYGVNGASNYGSILNNQVDSIGNWTDRALYSNGAGIYESGTGLKVIGNTVREYGSVGIKVFASLSAIISGNFIESNTLPYGSAGCSGIISDEEGIGNGSGVSITGNTILALSDMTQGIYMADGSRGSTINGNNINIKSFSISGAIKISNTLFANIVGNTIIADSGNVNVNLGIYVSNQFASPGISGVRNINLTNNTIISFPYGYYLSGAQNISISGGRVNQDSVTASAGVYIKPFSVDAKNISITGVTFNSKANGYIYNFSDSSLGYKVSNVILTNNFCYSGGNYWFIGAGDSLIRSFTDYDMLGVIGTPTTNAGKLIIPDVTNFKIAGGSKVSGAGTINALTKWSSTSAVTNSLINDDGSNVSIPIGNLLVAGSTNNGYALNVSGIATNGSALFDGSIGPALDFKRTTANSSIGANIFNLNGYNGATRVIQVQGISGGATDAGGWDWYAKTTGTAMGQIMRIMGDKITFYQPLTTTTFTAASGTISGTSFPLLVVDRSSGTGNNAIEYAQAAITRAYVGLSGTSQLITGMADGDYGIRAQTRGIYMSTDGGSTMHFKIAATTGAISFNATNTTTGTTGAQTINKASGTVNIAAAGTSLVVTNSLITTSSIIQAIVETNDANKSKVYAVVPAAGSFTIYVDIAPAAEIKIGWWAIN